MPQPPSCREASVFVDEPGNECTLLRESNDTNVGKNQLENLFTLNVSIILLGQIKATTSRNVPDLLVLLLKVHNQPIFLPIGWVQLQSSSPQVVA